MTDLKLLKSSIDIRGHAQRIGLTFDKKQKKALCPNHDDSNPSLGFKDGSCHCFACGFHEDVIGLHQKVRSMTFEQAIEDIGRMYNLNGYAESPKSRIRKRKERLSSRKKASDQAKNGSEESPGANSAEYSDVYEELIRFCGPPAGAALEYLTGRRRGLLWETIERFRLCTIKDYQATQTQMEEMFGQDRLIMSGICNDRGNLIFFKHRIIIPFVDTQGHITTMRGRYFYDDSPDPEAGTPKMLGLAGRPAKVLFNLPVLKDYTEGTVYVAEGEFDTMVLEQYGFKAVGVLGMNNWDSSWMGKALSKYRVEICIDNPRIDSHPTEKKNHEQAIKTISSSLWDAGNTSTYRPQMPLDCKDVTEFLVGMKGEFQE